MRHIKYLIIVCSILFNLNSYSQGGIAIDLPNNDMVVDFQEESGCSGANYYVTVTVPTEIIEQGEVFTIDQSNNAIQILFVENSTFIEAIQLSNNSRKFIYKCNMPGNADWTARARYNCNSSTIDFGIITKSGSNFIEDGYYGQIKVTNSTSGSYSFCDDISFELQDSYLPQSNYSLKWDFGDSEYLTSSTSMVTHKYRDASTNVKTVKVWLDHGCEEGLIFLDQLDIILENESYIKKSVCGVQLETGIVNSDIVFSVNGANSNDIFNWEIDGNVFSDATPIVNILNEKDCVTTLDYEKNGTNCQINNISDVFSVVVPEIQIITESGCPGSISTFSYQSNIDPSYLEGATVLWSFDGGGYTEDNYFLFTNPGNHTVEIQIELCNENVYSASQNINLEEHPSFTITNDVYGGSNLFMKYGGELHVRLDCLSGQNPDEIVDSVYFITIEEEVIATHNVGYGFYGVITFDQVNPDIRDVRQIYARVKYKGCDAVVITETQNVFIYPEVDILSNQYPIIIGEPVTYNFIVPDGAEIADWSFQYDYGDLQLGGYQSGDFYYVTSYQDGYPDEVILRYNYLNGPVNLESRLTINTSVSNFIVPFAPRIKGGFVNETFVVSLWVSTEDYDNFDQVGVRIHMDDEPGVLYRPSGTAIEGWKRISAEVLMPPGTDNFKIELVNDQIGRVCYFDDLRIQPSNSSMVTYVYDPYSLRFVALLDENNYASFYEYDSEGNLIRIKKETERGMKTIQENRNNITKQKSITED
jgi:hypothetical protein